MNKPWSSLVGFLYTFNLDMDYLSEFNVFACAHSSLLSMIIIIVDLDTISAVFSTLDLSSWFILQLICPTTPSSIPPTYTKTLVYKNE